MKDAFRRILRGRVTARMLRRFGIDPKRYWLLIDLFSDLSERREMFSQLGRDEITLKVVVWLYFAMACLAAFLMMLVGPPIGTYFRVFLGMTAFVLLMVLLSETGNSLVNPTEALVLAHQPINGATYIGAKLTHLVRILIYLVPGLNLVPSLLGLTFKGADWSYPLQHMLAAFAVGIAAALLCCTVYGWLIRFVPAARLKAIGQVADTAPILIFILFQYGRDFLAHTRLHFLPEQAGPRLAVAAIGGVLVSAVVIFGLRSLSRDYLIRVATIVHGRSGVKNKPRRSRIAALAAKFCGGPASRAGFEYVARMMRRDWQFRRAFVPLLPGLIAPAVLLFQGLRIDPFSGRFSAMHVMPHVFGGLLFWTCMLLPYGNDYKASWVFLATPARAFGPFARGVWALLSIWVILIPHIFLFALLAWFWGFRSAALFTVYSLAVACLYLALELRLVDGVPFGKQPDASRNAYMMPMMIGGAFVVAIAVALQYFLLFRSPAIVLAAAAMLGAAAWFLTRSSLQAFEVAIRYNLGLLSTESSLLYKEIEV